MTAKKRTNWLERLLAPFRPPAPAPKEPSQVQCCMSTSDGRCRLPATRFYILKRRHSDEQDGDSQDEYELPMATCDKHFVHWEPSQDMPEHDYADRLVLSGVHDA